MNKLKTWVFLMALTLSGASVIQAAWTTQRLTTNAGDSFRPDVAVSGANVYVVWCDETPGNREIYLVKSANNGATWQDSQRLTSNAGDSTYPSIAVSATNIYIVWRDETPGNAEIYFRRSIDGGATWQVAKRLTNNSGFSDYPDIAVSGTNVYVIWEDYTPGNYEIYFRKSADGGATWQSAQRLTNNPGFSSNPRIAKYGSNVYIVWSDSNPGNEEIYFCRSADSGTTWQPALRLTKNAGYSEVPSVAVNGASIYVAWMNDTPGKYDIFFVNSADKGITWQTAKRLTSNSGWSMSPDIAVSDTNIYVTWYDDTPGNEEIFFRRSADGGATWQASQRLTFNSGDSYAPAIAVNAINLYIVYTDLTPGNGEIYVKYSPLL